MTRSPWRRSLPQGCSVTSATASTSTTQRTVPHKCRCPTPLHTPPTMAIRAKNGPTATSVRSLATGPNPVMMTRPFEAFFTLVRTITIFAHLVRLCGAFGVLVCTCAFRVLVFAKHLYCPRQSLSALTGDWSPPNLFPKIQTSRKTIYSQQFVICNCKWLWRKMFDILGLCEWEDTVGGYIIVGEATVFFRSFNLSIS